MAIVKSYPLLHHLRSETNRYVLHFRNGKLKRQGPGLAFWFSPLSAAVAELPVEDCETGFIIRERSQDFQEVTVQGRVVYRISDPAKAAQRVNFSLVLETGAWKETPLERLGNFWFQLAQKPARAYLAAVPVEEAIRSGAEAIAAAIDAAFRAEPEVAAMGLAVVGVSVLSIAPAAELEKALQTPTREAIQQKADEAVFQRRALAVEKERAIKENELATEIELAKRQEALIQRQADNQLLTVQREAETAKVRTTAELERAALEARGKMEQEKLTAQGRAAARDILSQADAKADQRRVEVWEKAPGKVIAGLAFQELARKLQSVNHLNITPDLLAQSMKTFFEDQGEK